MQKGLEQEFPTSNFTQGQYVLGGYFWRLNTSLWDLFHTGTGAAMLHYIYLEMMGDSVTWQHTSLLPFCRTIFCHFDAFLPFRCTSFVTYKVYEWQMFTLLPTLVQCKGKRKEISISEIILTWIWAAWSLWTCSSVPLGQVRVYWLPCGTWTLFGLLCYNVNVGLVTYRLLIYFTYCTRIKCLWNYTIPYLWNFIPEMRLPLP